ncbi:hypothetical protein ACIA74_24565 [Streptomyces sp. NPDC051658]|nr:hypothetical protein OG520_35200 [Streptomyces sp. NBC_00984]
MNGSSAGHMTGDRQGVVAVGRIRIVRRPQLPSRPPPLDLRTPSGRPLPY